LGGGWTAGEDPLENATTTFYDRLHVPLVNVEVTATNREGVPIRNLTADDFEILEDGQLVEITHFSAPSTAEGPPVRGDSPTSLPAMRDRDVYLVFYFDDFNVNPRLRGAALAQLHSFVSQSLPPGVKAFVVRFDGRLHVECEPSQRSEDLVAALEQVQKHTPMDFTREGEDLVRSMQESARTVVRGGSGIDANNSGLADFMRSDYLPLIENYASQEYHRNRTSLQGLTDFVSYLRGMHGRKAVLWLGSIETRVGENLFRTYQQLFPAQARTESLDPMMDSMRYDLTGDLRDLIRFANSHRVSFYPLGSLGTGVDVTFDYANRIFEGPGYPGSAGPTDLRAEAEALNVMSLSTGGRTLFDSRLTQDLAQVSGELTTSYSLAYKPPTPDDGKYHQITVRVKRDGVMVRHRQGYRMMDDGGRMAALTISAAMLGAVDNPLGIAVGSRDSEPRDDGLFLVPVTVEIPIGDLVLLPQEEQHVARISIASVVRDDKGRLSDVHEREYPITIANDRLVSSVGERATFVIGMLLRKGPHRITVSVRDNYSSIESIGFVDVVVGAGVGASPG
jgi:VWFA-related protein